MTSQTEALALQPGSQMPQTEDPVPQISARDYSQRLGLIYPVRQAIPTIGGGLVGVIMGMSLGSKTAALRFRAENAHRLPTTTKGWYLYHKSKNYYGMWGGLKESGRMGFKIAFWTSAFVAVEERVDNWRHGSKDVLSTVVSGLACAGAFSAWNRFPLVTAAKTVRMTLVASVGYGLVQDAMGVLRGREVGYVSFVKRRVFGIGKAASA